ncbi:hypothetical protein HDV04_001150 [Boothiomyces sp. JEL0838]|nr:hypothetical protein HDV04_001150 [Boothiomyces sp. JEL0838]
MKESLRNNGGVFIRAKMKLDDYEHLLSVWDVELLPVMCFQREKQLVMKWATSENLIDPSLIFRLVLGCEFTSIEFTRIFMKASFVGSESLFDYTLEKTIDVNNAFRFASAGGHFPLIKKLLQCDRVDLQLMKTNSFPILVSRGYFDIVLYICERVEGCIDARCLRLAVNGGHYEMTRYFLQFIDPSLDNNYCIRSAIRNAHSDIVELLLNDVRVTPSSDGLKFAISKEYIGITRLLLNDSRVEVDGCLKLAVDVGNIDIVQMLMEHSYYKQSNSVVKELGNSNPALCPFENVDENKKVATPFRQKKLEETPKYPTSPSGESEMNFSEKEKDSALLLAIKKSDEHIFNLLLSDPSINPSLSNNAPIRAAINAQNMEMVTKLLQDSRVDPSEYSNYCLYLAIKLKNINILTILLKHPKVNPMFMENNAISLAVQSENIEILIALLHDGRADPTALNQYPLKLAVMRQLPNFVSVLLKDNRVDPCIDSSFSLCEAVRLQNIEIVDMLLKDGRANPNDNGQYCIMEACKSGNLDIVKLLVADERVDPVCNDNAPIRFAVESGNFELVEYFLQLPNVDPSASNQDAIHSSIVIGNYDIFKLLLQDKRVDPSQREDESLINAVARNSIQIVQSLLDDPRISIELDDYYTFRLAIQLQNVEIVKMFLMCPTLDPNADDSFALRYICFVGNREILKLLLADARLLIPQSAQDSAVAGGNLDIFELLDDYRNK